MQNKIYFGTNLKMYKNISETVSFLNRLTEKTADLGREKIELFVIPSYPSLPDAVKIKNRDLVHLGAQNMGWEEQGQFTGEISPLMLQELGLDLVMIGHSERRHTFRENDFEENLKVLSALEHGFTALLCVGETETQKKYGISAEILREQIKIGCFGVKPEQTSKLWIAYEPVWSIGVNGTPASPEYAEEMHEVMRETVVSLFGEAGKTIPLLYGGSVNPGNAEALIVCPGIDGLFVGRSAWDADAFDALIRKSIAAAGRA